MALPVVTEKKLTVGLSDHNHLVSELMRNLGFEVLNESQLRHTRKPDLLVVPGGPDVAPRLYGEAIHAKTFPAPKTRDLKELNMIMTARIEGIPVLGICRGMQLAHVANGGNLIQHIEGHRGCAGGGHTIRDPHGTEVPNLIVTSSHHQAVSKAEAVGFGYEDVYTSVDLEGNEIVEVFADMERLVFGVQFHPEYRDATPGCLNLFRELIETKIFPETKKA